MCGIVGAVANNNVVPVLLDGLLQLEYRGYDSAGLVVTCNGLQRLRTTGRVTELQKLAHEKYPRLCRYCPYPLGNAWCTFRAQCTPSFFRNVGFIGTDSRCA